MYRIKNSKLLASLINYTNLNNMISEAEMKEFLNQAKELNFDLLIFAKLTLIPALAISPIAFALIKLSS